MLQSKCDYSDSTRATSMLQLTFCGTSAAALNQICAFCLANYHKLESEAETNRLWSRLMRTSEQSNLLHGGKWNTAYIHLKHYEGSSMNNRHRKWRVVKSHLSLQQVKHRPAVIILRFAANTGRESKMLVNRQPTTTLGRFMEKVLHWPLRTKSWNLRLKTVHSPSLESKKDTPR